MAHGTRGQRRLSSDCAYAQSDLSLLRPHQITMDHRFPKERTNNMLIKLCSCAGWSKSLQGVFLSNRFFRHTGYHISCLSWKRSTTYCTITDWVQYKRSALPCSLSSRRFLLFLCDALSLDISYGSEVNHILFALNVLSWDVCMSVNVVSCFLISDVKSPLVNISVQ